MTLSTILPAVLRICALLFKSSDLPGQRFSLAAITPTFCAPSTLTNVNENIMSFAETLSTFMSSPHFAVLGASKDQTKVGTEVGLVVLVSTISVSERDIVVDSEVVPG